MADLLSILSSGAASLAAHRTAAATASHNLENAATPGYARQRVALDATLPAERIGGAFVGRGVTVGAVTQARDRFVEAQLPAMFGQSARSEATAAALEGVHALDPEATGGLGDALSGFYGALRQLQQNPGDANLRQAAVASARTVALAFQSTRGALEDARSGLDAKIAGTVGEVNDAARSVADLNRQIRIARASGAEPNDLLDARQKSVDRLAELAGGVPVPTSEGDVSIALPGGVSLVAGDRAATLSAVPDPSNFGHLALKLAPAGGAPAPLSGVGGTIGGAFDARDGAIGTAIDQVDALAFDLGTALNAAHRAGYGVDGSTGNALFDLGSGIPDGAAARIRVAAPVAADPRKLATATAAGAPGDATGVAALLGTETGAVSGGLDPYAALASATSAFGATTRSARALADHDAGLADHLSSLRESASGVSIDEELVEMQKSQRAYEAVMKVIQTSNDLFDTLLSLK